MVERLVQFHMFLHRIPLRVHAGRMPALRLPPRLLLRRHVLPRLQQSWQSLLERLGRSRKWNPVLRTFWPGNTRFHRRQVKIEHISVLGLRRVGRMEQALLLVVGLDGCHVLCRATAQPQIAQRFIVHREDAAGGTVLWGHVRNGCAVCKRQLVETRSEELDEFSDHALLAQHLGHGKHQIGCRRAFLQLITQPHTHYLGDQHRYRLPQHGGLGFDSTDAPAQHTQAIDHGGVRVGAHQRVGIRHRMATLALGADKHDARQVLQIHLVTNTRVRRHDREIFECRLSPTQKRVPLSVARKLQLGIELQRLRRSEFVHLHRMVNYQFRWLQRIDQPWIAAQRLHRIAHCGEVDHRGHAGEVLQQHAARHERDFFRRNALLVPCRQRPHVLGLHLLAVLATQQILQQNSQRIRQMLHPAALRLNRTQAIDLKLFGTNVEGRPTAETIHEISPFCIDASGWRSANA